MRILRAISDLPWWTGLPMFFVGNLFCEYDFFLYIGMIMCLFGAWLFSKLLNYKDGSVACSIVCIPIFFFFMYYINVDHLKPLNLEMFSNKSTEYYGEACAVRGVIGMFLSLLSISGFKRN